MFTDIGNMLGGGKLTPQDELVHGEPLGPINDSDEVLTLAIQERAISFTGEDFDVYDLRADQPFCHVKGAMLHLPGKDKMRVFMENGDKVAVLDRKLIAMTPTYDIHRGNGEKMGWIEKEVVALTDTFDVYTEPAGGFGMFKPPPAYRIEGDFVDRQFVMKNSKGEAVAKVTKDSWIQFDAFNHYQLQIAPGMDTTLVVACACAIDEEFDEEHKKKKEE
ncbi:Pfam:DUF567 [Seminavis robusta]|uniref:Pfam:DUF567 n=1 Tax=Seminavis robusta TaxID=568900 RepID=A0A9N8E728_9STRA|nr:Pfam:DUF567 [Seminavis robusta]|eukprot:Sro692_g187990.1 Pfam:DUF567 (219) ;mRNA; r:7656-8312